MAPSFYTRQLRIFLKNQELSKISETIENLHITVWNIYGVSELCRTTTNLTNIERGLYFFSIGPKWTGVKSTSCLVTEK